MYEPTRGGTRGGAGDFKWSEVSADKDREHYLGHSINAPTGRWQKNKDIHWYNREKKQTDDERAQELAKIKEAEKEALSIALGFKPSKPVINGTNEATTSGANAIPVTGERVPRLRATSLTAASLSDADARSDDQEENRDDHVLLSKEEKRIKKLEKKIAKAEKKRHKREEKEARAMAEVVGRGERGPRHRERSASPRRGDRSYGRHHHHRDDDGVKDSRRDREQSPSSRRLRERKPYSEEEMKRERERDRRRWEDNLERQERAKGNWD